MAYVITETCIMCGVCKDQCPTNAIFEGEKRYFIKKELCISCGACAAICPVGAPKDEKEE
ncbi:MAG: 4Fe-4S binding protein [Oscillospiraceae bacterium]|nr:4Fe-4S binding protein [Oscillospiraceae bacterium]